MSLKILLAACFITGAFFGFFLWSFQWSVEHGMVLTELVKYPVENAFYISAHKAWTLVNQLTYLFLKLGIDPLGTSQILSALVGGFAFLTCGLFVFSFTRLIVLSYFFSFYVFYIYGQYVQGITYPVMWIGSGQTYGMLGVSAIAFFVALNSLSDLGSKFFWAPVLSAIHPSQGTWAVLIGLIENLITYKLSFFKILWKERNKFIAGLAIAVTSLLIHFVFFRVQIRIENAKEVSDLTLIALRNHWSEHFHTYNIYSLEFIRVGLFSLFSLSTLIFFHKELTFSQRRILLSVLISVFLAVIFSYVYWLSDENLVKNSIVLMMYPARLYTFAIWCSSIVIPCFFLTRSSNLGKAFGILLCLIYFSQGGGDAPSQKYVVFIQAFSLLLLVFYYFEQKLPRIKISQEKFQKVLTSIFVIFCLVSLIDLKTMWGSRQSDLKRNFKEDAFYKEVGKGSKMLLVAPGGGDNYLIRSKVAVLYNAGPLVLNYIPEAGVEFNKMFQEVYGVNFYDPGRNMFQIGGDISQDMVINLWESRSEVDWKDLASKFKFDRIIVPKKWTLNLPQITESEDLKLYKVESL